MTEDDKPPITEDDHAIQEAIVIMLGFAACIATALAAVAALRAPWIADLYNLVYDNSRPRKPESTGLFLFVFPGMLCAVFGANLMFPEYMIRRRASFPLRSMESRAVFVAFVALVMTTISIARSVAVLNRF